MIKTYKLIISYDGTHYGGWQKQKHDITIAGVLQETFERTFFKSISIIGASRTDAGVHALGQVAVAKTDLAIDTQQLLRAWNQKLPSDIIIRSLCDVDDNFHPQHNVIQKTYWYHIFAGKRPLPFVARYGYNYDYPFDIEKLNAGLQCFVGTHDFRSFCTGNDKENTIRTIDAISLEYVKRYNVYRICVKGPGFLRYMIRRIVGACLEVSSRKNLPLSTLTDALQEKNAEQTLPNAPAHGLLLYKIVYK